jgi:transporter family protein
MAFGDETMRSALLSWQLWALLSAAFAALTAIFAKIGVENVNADFATFIRTIIILMALGAILIGTGQWQPLGSVSGRSYLFLVLSGLATGGSWLCYFRALKLGDAARVAPIDKLSVVLVALFGVIVLGEKLSLPNWLGVVFIATGAVLVAYKRLRCAVTTATTTTYFVAGRRSSSRLCEFAGGVRLGTADTSSCCAVCFSPCQVHLISPS